MGAEGAPSTVLLLGGARSGKSDLSVEMARRHSGAVTVIATAQALDDDMAARIERHRAERPGWPTVEEPHDLVAAVRSSTPNDLLLVDCLTVWVSNLMWRGDSDAEIRRHAQDLGTALASRPGRSIVVSNEVGLGVHPETELGRRYRDVLGRVNVAVASQVDTTLLLVAGRAVRLDDPWTLLGGWGPR